VSPQHHRPPFEYAPKPCSPGSDFTQPAFETSTLPSEFRQDFPVPGSTVCERTFFYAPGAIFNTTLESVLFLRKCSWRRSRRKRHSLADPRRAWPHESVDDKVVVGVSYPQRFHSPLPAFATKVPTTPIDTLLYRGFKVKFCTGADMAIVSQGLLSMIL
jgi:hypothetical protein